MMFYRFGPIGVVSVDYLAVPQAKAFRRIGSLPAGVRPLTSVSDTEDKADGSAAIGRISTRGGESFGQLEVKRDGTITAWVSSATASGQPGYYYGQVVFLIA